MYILVPKMSGYVRNFNDAMKICFYHSDPEFNNKYLKTNIKSYDNKEGRSAFVRHQ